MLELSMGYLQTYNPPSSETSQTDEFAVSFNVGVMLSSLGGKVHSHTSTCCCGVQRSLPQPYSWASIALLTAR